MPNLTDIAYATATVLSAPIWLSRGKARAKVLRAFCERDGDVPVRAGDAPTVMIHAVSLGEINATRSLVTALRQARPDLHFILSATTATGLARARELYRRPDETVIAFPLDFSAYVERTLDRLRPAVVVLMELEVWPNFIEACRRRRIPVLLVNGRLTEKSFRNYRRFGLLTRPMFRRLERVCAQEPLYAQRFIEVGVPAERVNVTGTMKFDTAQVGDTVVGADELAVAVGLGPGDEPIWVCGSTGPGEEDIVLRVYRRLRADFPALRLVIVPRHPERFDAAADLIRTAGFDVLRRSNPQSAIRNPQSVILGDTMGELRKFYALADVVFVGRSLVDLGSRLHGSDMIEPAALGRPVVVGPFTGNFAEPMNAFRAVGAMAEVGDEAALEAVLRQWLRDPAAAAEVSHRAREVVVAGRGATERHARLILEMLSRVGSI